MSSTSVLAATMAECLYLSLFCPRQARKQYANINNKKISECTGGSSATTNTLNFFHTIGPF